MAHIMEGSEQRRPQQRAWSSGGRGSGRGRDSSLSAGTKKTCRVCKEALCCQRAGIHYSPQSFTQLLSAHPFGFVVHFTSNRCKVFLRTGRCCFFVLFCLLLCGSYCIFILQKLNHCTGRNACFFCVHVKQ